MSKPFILVSDGMDNDAFLRLQSISDFEVHAQKKVNENELKNLLPKVNGIVIRSSTKMTKPFIDLAPNLKYIIRAGEGTDNIDKSYCKEKGIKVSNTPGANSNAAAEQAIALMFAVLRKTALADKSVKENKWEKDKLSGWELAGKTLGVVGMGKIAQLVVKRLKGFDLNVKYSSLFEVPECGMLASLEDVFSSSDIVTIHAPLDASTKNLVNANLLKLMKPTAILINAARGGIVNEADLYEYLKNNKIRGAGLDVFASEPLAKSPLLELNNIVLTPHLGASTLEAQVRVSDMAVDQLVQFFKHNNLQNEVVFNA